MLLGKISLEIEWNANDAEKYYAQALDYFQKSREKRDAVSLYAAMSDDLKKQTAPVQKPTTLNQWKRIEYHDEDPLKLYNTANAPVWYVNDKEKNCLFMLGFCKYISENFKAASEIWHKLPEVDTDLSYLKGTIYESTAKRLYAACYDKHMGITSQEKGEIKNNKIATMIKFAEFFYLQEKFALAINMFERIAVMPEADNQVKFICWASIGSCYGAIPEKPKDMEYYKKALAFKNFEGNPLYPEILFRYADSLMGYADGAQEAIPLLKIYLKKYPDGRHAFQAWYYLIHAYVYTKNYAVAQSTYKEGEFKNYPDNPFVKEVNRVLEIIQKTGKYP
jgi:tetratricopeptide (TPR) repeat protein